MPPQRLMPQISLVPNPNKIRVLLHEDHIEKKNSIVSPDPSGKLTQSISFQSTSIQAEKIPHKKKKQPKILSNLPSPTVNDSVATKTEPEPTSSEPKSILPKPMIIAIVAVSLIAVGALAFGIYSFVQMSKTTTNTATTTPTSGLKWCSTATTVAGTGNGGCQVIQSQGPWSTVLDSSGALYFADSSCHRIAKWIVGSPTGTTVAGQLNGISNNTATYLNRPYGTAVDSNNNIYVADTNNHRVQFWPSGGSSGYTIAGTVGVNGSALNQLSTPYSVALDSNSSIFYVADTGNHRILKFVFNITTGTVVAGGQGPGTATNQLNFPTCIYFDSASNSLFIANMNAHSVVQWVIGSSIWKLVAGIPGSYGYGSLSLNNPQGVALDSSGNIYVADSSNHRIQLFRSGSATGITIAGSGNIAGVSSSLLNNPRSVFVDSQLNLYVADTNNDRVQMFARC